MFDPALPHGRHYYWKSHKLGPLTDDVIAVVVEHARHDHARRCRRSPIFTFGGAVARVPEDATAFPHRDAAHDINIVGSWLPEQAGEADRHIGLGARLLRRARAPQPRRLRELHAATTPAERVRAAYTDAQWARLGALKAKYDPTNFFRRNANIAPA